MMHSSSLVNASPAVVLVIDPEPATQRAIRDRLAGLGYMPRLVDDYESAIAMVSSTPPDVVLLTNPVDGEGWTSLQIQLSNWGIPVLKLSDVDTGELSGAARGPASEAADAKLRTRIDAALRSRSVQDALRVENARLAAERMYDPLTGLFNRRYIMIRVEEETLRSLRHKYPLACLLFDIDRFDDVNAVWGHHAGDAVLRDMAHVITRTLRATDISARYRDDELLVLLTDTNGTGAQVAANRLREAISAHNFFNRASPEPISLTVSMGIAYWEPPTEPGKGNWEPQLLGLAERALKAAKLSGPNHLVMMQDS